MGIGRQGRSVLYLPRAPLRAFEALQMEREHRATFAADRLPIKRAKGTFCDWRGGAPEKRLHERKRDRWMVRAQRIPHILDARTFEGTGEKRICGKCREE